MCLERGPARRLSIYTTFGHIALSHVYDRVLLLTLRFQQFTNEFRVTVDISSHLVLLERFIFERCCYSALS